MKVFQGNAERGRTMLEIIMVIAVASILMLIGTRLWKTARTDAKAHAVMQQLVAIKSARQTGLREHAYDPMFRAEEGPHGIMLSVRNGMFNEANKDFYWINVIATDEDFRDALVQLGRERLDPCLVRNSETEVTFYFPKFKSKLYVDEETGPNKDIEPDIPEKQDCQNGGHWNNYMYKCDCPPEWKGLACEIKDLCYGVECGEHGSCEEGSCVCTGDFYGAHCEKERENCGQYGAFNDDQDRCICDTTKALTCNKGSDYWCCGDNKICGETKGECVDGEGTCTFYFYAASDDTEYATNCFYTVGITPSTVTHMIGHANRSIAKPSVTATVARGGCPEGQYCTLIWKQASWMGTTQPKFTRGDTGAIYGKCQRMGIYDTNPLLAPDSPFVPYSVGKGCPAGQYCLLKWRNGTCTTVSSGDTGEFSGVCVSMNKKSGDCPY